MDRALYKQHMQQALAGVQGLAMHDGAVIDLLLEQQQGGRPRVAGVKLASGEAILCRSVVVTTGTFLRGVIHIGSRSRPAGRMPSSVASGKQEGACGSCQHPVWCDQGPVTWQHAAAARAAPTCCCNCSTCLL